MSEKVRLEVVVMGVLRTRLELAVEEMVGLVPSK